MKIGIVGNTNKPPVKSVIKEFVKYLKQSQTSVIYDRALVEFLDFVKPDQTIDIKQLGCHCDMVVTFGGDGTILSTAQHVGKADVPILGVNIGGLGFLAEVLVEELEETVALLLQQKYTIINRMVLQIELEKKDKRNLTFHAFNDLVVDKGPKPRLIYIKTFVNNTFLNTYRSDGIIVATPTGSTAYSLSAGGPLLMPDMQAILVTPICPHSLTVRPVILSEDSEIKVTILPDQDPALINIDGQRTETLEPGESVIIRKAGYKIKWISTGKRDFFEILRTKLHWGVGQPNQ